MYRYSDLARDVWTRVQHLMEIRADNNLVLTPVEASPQYTSDGSLSFRFL